MNESLFTHGAFDKAQPLAQPDFAVMLTLASLRQLNTPTARLAIARAGEGGAIDQDCTLAILAGETSRECDAIASFYDLSHFEANESWPLLGSERAVNLGVSTNVQSLGLNASDRQETYEGF